MFFALALLSSLPFMLVLHCPNTALNSEHRATRRFPLSCMYNFTSYLYRSIPTSLPSSMELGLVGLVNQGIYASQIAQKIGLLIECCETIL